jgi:D-3-phosphoglycerate dehydrogenase
VIPPVRTSDQDRKVLLLENIHRDAARHFRDEGFEVVERPGSPGEEELIHLLEGVSVLGIRSKTQVTRGVIEESPHLATIGAFCIGTNQIDLDTCLERGIPVFNAPFANTRSVVEMALGQIIALYRDLFPKSQLLHTGTWWKKSTGTREIRGKRLGIIGYGNIGVQLSIVAEAMGMEVHFYDIAEKLALGNARPCRTLEELLRISDVVTVHVDGRPENRNLIGAREFEMLPDGAIFLNLSRGFVVDIDALAAAIDSGKVRGAAIDVFPEEPHADGQHFVSPLQGKENVILTPHIGGNTEEAQEHIGHFVPDRLLNFMGKGTTNLSVKFPNLQLPELRGSHRLVHVHRNVPGILARINQVMANRGINITGQYLQTSPKVGYVITDVGQDYQEGLVQELREIPDTIRVRVLY